MKLRIAICDDEQNQIEYLTSILSPWSTQNKHTCDIRTFNSAEAFLFEYEDNKVYDLLLLDVEMNGMTGVDLAKMIRRDNENIQIIFVTGYSDYISEGYEVDALHYLIKPVSPEKLHSVLDRAVHNLQKNEKQLYITYDHQTALVSLPHITYVEAQKQYIMIHTSTEAYRMKCSLTDIEAQLDEYFFKCQRSFIVNLRYVARINSSCVTLKNGDEVPISRGMAEKIGKKIIQLSRQLNIAKLFLIWQG